MKAYSEVTPGLIPFPCWVHELPDARVMWVCALTTDEISIFADHQLMKNFFSIASRVTSERSTMQQFGLEAVRSSTCGFYSQLSAQ